TEFWASICNRCRPRLNRCRSEKSASTEYRSVPIGEQTPEMAKRSDFWEDESDPFTS
ncbi:hypothetical protein KI387_002643, partial [Taxus chinensis]